jgi:hypothetical protein
MFFFSQVFCPFVTDLLTLPHSNRILSILMCRILTDQGDNTKDLKATESVSILIFWV